MEAEQILVSRRSEISTHLINNVFNKSDINQAVIWIVNDLSKRYRRCSCDPVVIQKTLELWLEYVDSDRRYSYSQEIWSNEFTQLKGRNGYVFVMTGYQPGYYFVADSEDIYVVQLSKNDCKSHQRAIRTIIDKYNSKEYKTTKQLGIYDENLIASNRINNMRKLKEYITVEESGSYDFRPSNKKELKELIDRLIDERGPNCDLNDIDVSRVTDMSELFRESNFRGDISKWDVSNVKDMSKMFLASYFNGDISGWNVGSVKYMSEMFRLSSFNGDISKWNVRNVIDMSYMFASSNFDRDISKWDVSNVHDMAYMFEGSVFTGYISKWDVHNVRNMEHMFSYSKFRGDLSKWDVRNLNNLNDMFENSPLDGKEPSWYKD